MRTGRPVLPKGKAKDSVLSIRLTNAEREAINSVSGPNASEWARAILMAEVKRLNPLRPFPPPPA